MTIRVKYVWFLRDDMAATDIILVLFNYFEGAEEFWSEFAGTEGVGMFFRVPEDEVTRLEFVLCRTGC